MKTKTSKKNIHIKFLLSILLIFLALGFFSNLGVLNPENDENKLMDSNLKTSQSVHWDSREVAICTEDGDKYYFTSIYDELGSSFIAWTDQRDESEDRLYLQKLNSSTGQVQWIENGLLISNNVMYHDGAYMISDGAGGVIIAWEDHRTGSADKYGDIYAQRVNSTGDILWTTGGVAICSTNDSQCQPHIVSDGCGGAIITWSDGRNGAYNYDIYAQRINSTGHTQWIANGTAVCNELNSQVYHAVVSDGLGGAIVLWQVYLELNDALFAQRINSTGNVQWIEEGVKISDYLGSWGNFQLISDNNGGATTVWLDWENGQFNPKVYAQKIDSNGTLQWGNYGIPVCTSTGNQNAPRIIGDGDEGVIILWKDDRNGNYNIYAQKINLNGEEQWTHDGVKICNPKLVYSLNLVSDGTGGAIIAWLEWSGNTGRIYTQRIDDEGNTKWTPNGVAVVTASGMERMSLVSNGLGGAIVFMNKYEYPYNNIYARCIPHEGIANPSSNLELILIIVLSIVIISIIAVSIFVVLKKRKAGKLSGEAARDKTIEKFMKKHNRQTLDPDFRLGLARHYQDKGDIDQAILNYNIVLELDPDNQEARASLNSINPLNHES
ncbi:MAG: hypothetical protein JW891_18505 [Candidatus Lokiarchaeota archaeon]|nr:hypothetical protein [Candidatus Lokiarchaeota archaeon]